MRGSRKHERIWRYATWALGLATIFGPVVAFCLRLPDDSNLVAPLTSIISFIRTQASPILLVAFALILISQLIRLRVGNPWAWKAVEKLLDELRVHCIDEDCLSDPVHHHRITLFRHYRFKLRPSWTRIWTKGEPWKPPWAGWLVQVARSGHTTQKSRKTFLAPDNADYAEGFAGETWARSSRLDVKNLEVPIANEDDSIKEYAQKTWTSVEYVRAKLNSGDRFPCSMSGFQIEADGHTWGVVVIDSARPDGIKDSDSHNQAMLITQTTLAQLAGQL